MADKETIKLPKTPALCADLLYKTRQNRLKLQKEVDKLQATETALSNYFVETLPKSQASGIAGKMARVQIETKDIPQVEDWEKFYAHIKKTGSFDLLQRRVSEGAVKERWENKAKVPGVVTFHVKKVSCTLLK